MKKNIHKIILLILILLFIAAALSLCEIYLNRINFQKKPIFLDFTNIGLYKNYRLDTNLVYTVNKEQYRNIIKTNDSNKTEISFIGDSVTWSYGASDSATYPISFEKLINQKSPSSKTVQVNNFGIPGYGLDQEYLLAKNYIIPEFKPKILVWNINFNDLWDSNFTCLFTKKNDQWLKISAKQNTSYWYGWYKIHFPKFITNSKLSNLLWYQFINKIVGSSGDGRYTFGCTPHQTDWSPELQNEIIQKLNYFIDDLNNELKKSNSQLIITLVPYQKYFSNQYRLSSLDLAYSLLKDNLQKQNLNFIDFNELILEQIDPKFYQNYRISDFPIDPANNSQANLSQLYFLSGNVDLAPDNWRHPNQKTYDLMATILNNYVRKKITL